MRDCIVVVIAMIAMLSGVALADPAAPAKAGAMGDLRFAVTPAKAQFGAGELLKFGFEFTNTGKSDFCIYNRLLDHMYADNRDFDRCAEIVLTDLGTKQVWRVSCEAEILRKYRNTPTIVLKPDIPFRLSFEFEDVLQFIPKGAKASQESLPAGTYEARVTLYFQSDPGAKMRYWSGTVTSEPVRVEIMAAAVKK